MLQQIQMPYVRFVSDVRETRDAAGHKIFDNIVYAHITPRGGKDEVIKVADEWLKELLNKSMTRGPFDPAVNEYGKWHEAATKALEKFRAGEEMTVDGTPIRACLAFSKAEIAQAESVKIFSIEDLASCNEEAMQRMGMGSRNLKEKAKKLLEGQSGNKLALENEALRVKLEALEAKLQQMLDAGFQAPAERKKPGRKPKTE